MLNSMKNTHFATKYNFWHEVQNKINTLEAKLLSVTKYLGSMGLVFLRLLNINKYIK